MKTDDELKAKYTELLKDTGFLAYGVQHVNFKPHPFMIGPQHFPDEHEGIYIMPEKAPCAMQGCGLSVKEHTSDHVLFVQANRNMTNTEAGAWLKSICKDLEEDKLDGIAFIESEFKITS